MSGRKAERPPVPNHRPKFQAKFGVAEEESDGPGEGLVSTCTTSGLVMGGKLTLVAHPYVVRRWLEF